MRRHCANESCILSMVWNLYEDQQLKIKIEDDCGFFEFNLYIKNKEEEKKYKIPLKIMGESSVTNRGELESKLDAASPKIKESLKKAGLTVDALHAALCVAHWYRAESLASDRDTEFPSFLFRG